MIRPHMAKIAFCLLQERIKTSYAFLTYAYAFVGVLGKMMGKGANIFCCRYENCGGQ